MSTGFGTSVLLTSPETCYCRYRLGRGIQRCSYGLIEGLCQKKQLTSVVHAAMFSQTLTLTLTLTITQQTGYGVCFGCSERSVS